MENLHKGVITFSEFNSIEAAIMEYAILLMDDNELNEAKSLLGKAGFKITRSKGIISLLATAGKGLSAMMIAAMKGDKEKVKALANDVSREDVIELLLKMDKVSLGLVSAPLGLISEITGWNLEINKPDTSNIIDSINAIIEKLKHAVDPKKLKRYTQVFNKLKMDVA